MKKKYANLSSVCGALAAIILCTLTSSCSGDFMKEYSQDLSRVKTAEDLNELLMGDCVLPLALFEGGSSFSTQNENFMVVHFMGDELQETIGLGGDPDRMSMSEKYYPYFTWQSDCCIDYQGRNSLAANEEMPWNVGYERINNCNMVIDAADGLDDADKESDALREHVKGECHYLRAGYYLMLVNLYAKPYAPSTASATPGVPVKTSSNIEDKDYTRNTVAEVYQQIIADLDAAECELADVSAPASIYHVGIDAVYILRSRVALYMQNWSEAQRYARLALAQNDYLQDMRNWNADLYPISSSNKEVVYSNGASCFGNAVYQRPKKSNSWSGVYAPVYSVSDHLAGLYDDGDGRKSGYITNRDDVSNGCWSYHKIDNSPGSWDKYKTASDVFCIRTAEAYLNLAEADAHLGEDAEACQYVDKLRARRIADAAQTSMTGSGLVNFIREERERELCFEGHRWFDLRRYQTDTTYPYDETIEHTMTWYVTIDYDDVPDHTSYYRLEKNDDAYTLNIPQNVRDFQNSIGSNYRPVRQPFKTVTYSTDDE